MSIIKTRGYNNIITAHWQEVQTDLKRLTDRPVVLVAVSKTQSAEAIRNLYRAGCRDFGENYVQEWQKKYLLLKADCPDIRWHFIGQLQGNKLAPLVGNVALIHSLSSLAHLKKIHALAQARAVMQPLLLQVNLSGETTKSGIQAEECHAFLQATRPCPRAPIVGLMTFPPPTADPESNRLFFRRLRELGEKHRLTEYSMGTSGDWTIAVQEGATIVRLGTTLFGNRKYP